MLLMLFFILIWNIIQAQTVLPCIQPNPPTEINYEFGDWHPSKWGSADRFGALNYITPQKVLSATQLVQHGKTFGLAVVNTPDFPAYGDRYFYINAENRHLGGITDLSFFEDEVEASIGVGTHIDGLGHISINDTFYNGITLEQMNPGPKKGVKKLSNSDMPPIVTRFVLLDIATYKGVKRMESGEIIYPSDIVGAARKQGVCISSGDVVLLYTGWLQVWLEDQDANTFINTEPGIGVEAAQYLADLEVVAIGADNWGIEVVPGAADTGIFHAHQILIPKYGIYLLENLNLKPLLDAGYSEGMFTLGVPRFLGSVQTVINPIAIV